jgi:hypothetical protein
MKTKLDINTTTTPAMTAPMMTPLETPDREDGEVGVGEADADVDDDEDGRVEDERGCGGAVPKTFTSALRKGE